MGLEQVRQEILEQAEEKATFHLEQAKKEAREINSKAAGEIAEYEQNARKNHNLLVEAMEKKMLAQARFDAQRMQMNTKKEQVQDVLHKVRQAIIGLSKAEKQKFLQQLLTKAQQELQVDNVFVNPSDISLFSSVSPGMKAVAKIIHAGLQAQNKEGTISIDLSINELLESAQQEMLVEISEVLFGKN